MARITKKQRLESLAISLPVNQKALDYSDKEENSHTLVLSFSIVGGRAMQRIYCRGLEVYRIWDDEPSIRVRNYIRFNMWNAYYFTENNKWQLEELIYSNDYRFNVVLNIEDLDFNLLPEKFENKISKYVNKSIFTGYRAGGPLDDFESLNLRMDKQVEYLSKYGNQVLLQIYLNKQFENISKLQIKFILENDLTINEALMYLKNNIKNIELLKKLEDCNISIEEYEFLKKYLSDKKIIEYKQLNKRTSLFYIDYLNMLEILGLPINSKTLMPKQIKRKHDEVVEILGTLRDLKRVAKLRKLDKTFVKPSKKYEKIETDHLQVITLTNYDSFDLETRELGHCVRDSYFERAALGETTILAVRLKEKLDKPFYTIEMRENEVKQFYGKANKTIEQASNFKRELKQIKKQLNSISI